MSFTCTFILVHVKYSSIIVRLRPPHVVQNCFCTRAVSYGMLQKCGVYILIYALLEFLQCISPHLRNCGILKAVMQ